LPNLDPWINQQNSNKNKEESTTTSELENHLLSIRDEHQNRIGPKHHPTYNERHQKIIEMIEWTLEKYKANIKKNQQNEEQALFKDDVSMYRLEENTLDYVLFRIREGTGKLY
jgi:hypothetical protein